MATVRKMEKGKITHVEAEGCIVNIHENLTDAKGRKVTRIEVCCDDYAGEQPWRVEGRTKKYMGCRVIQTKAKRRE